MTFTEEDLRFTLKQLEREVTGIDQKRWQVPTVQQQRHHHRRPAALLWAAAVIVGVGLASVVLPSLFGRGDRVATGDSGSVVVEVRLAQTTVKAPKTISGYLVVTNNTGANIVVPNGACYGWATVSLTNATVLPQPRGSLLVACASLVIPPGTTRERIGVSTRYSSCSQSGQGSLPRCGSERNGDGSLPPGEYKTTVATTDIGHPITVINPVMVRIVSS